VQRFFDRPGSVVWLGVMLCGAFLALVFRPTGLLGKPEIEKV